MLLIFGYMNIMDKEPILIMKSSLSIEETKKLLKDKNIIDNFDLDIYQKIEVQNIDTYLEDLKDYRQID